MIDPSRLSSPFASGAKGPGLVIWFTGLSGAGKSTIAELVGRELEVSGASVEYLDGDVVRTHLSKGLGFSKEDRDANIERVGWVASRLARHGATVLVSAISPYAATRETARALVDECARRDVKGLYEKAFRGEIAEFTGVSDPYEAPDSPELRVETEGRTPEECARDVLDYLSAVTV